MEFKLLCSRNHGPERKLHLNRATTQAGDNREKQLEYWNAILVTLII